MKHGMTLSRFEAMITELMRLDHDSAKLIILGRDTAFHDDHEFRSIILGRQITTGGQEVSTPGRRAFRQIQVRDFTLDEAKSFVERFFPIAAQEAFRGSENGVGELWIAARIGELIGGSLDELLARPVHAQMLCQIATDDQLELSDLSKFRLFDLFVHFLLDREVRKRGRDHRFSLEARRNFNRALALWLWQQGGVSTVTLASVPSDLCLKAARQVTHSYDEAGLRKELTAGCLVEKGSSGTIYFGHRSLQEFLVAEELIVTDLMGTATTDPNAALWYLGFITPEVSAFLVDAAASNPANREKLSDWLQIFNGMQRNDLPRLAMRLFVELLNAVSGVPLHDSKEPWIIWLRYFAANEAVEFEPRSQRALDELISICREHLHAGRHEQAAVLLLVAEVLQRNFEERSRLAIQIVALWLEPLALRKHIQEAGKVKGKPYYVEEGKDLAFWAFLHAAKIASSPPSISINASTLRRRILSVFQFGLSDFDESDSEALIAGIPVQNLYRVWGIREAELERVRRYFGDANLRDRIVPLEVVVAGRQRDHQRVQAPKVARNRSVLKLRDRPKPS